MDKLKNKMQLSDKFRLVLARLRTRKSRTVVTILTMSVLFGVVIAAMMIVQGNFNNLERLNQEAYGDNIILQTHYSGDNERAEEEIARAAKRLNGVVAGKITHYCSKQQVDIANLTPYREPVMATFQCDQSRPGEYIAVIESQLIADLINLDKTPTNSIGLVLPVTTAGKLQNMAQPARTAQSVTEYIRAVTSQSKGYDFEATTANFNDVVSNPTTSKDGPITYTIVGLTPSRNITTFSPDTLTIFSDMMPIENFPPTEVFTVVNPDVSILSQYYEPQQNNSTIYLVSFSNLEDANRWLSGKGYQEAGLNASIADDVSVGSQEFLTTRLANERAHRSYDKTVTIFAITFTIVSTIIMAGTLSRVIDDEKSSIALYRSIGATTAEILQIFVLYMLVISLLVIICATVLGILLSLCVTFIFGASVTATARSLFLLPELKLLIMIGFDWKIVFIWISIIVISIVSLLTMVKKLTSKDIIKDLKR